MTRGFLCAAVSLVVVTAGCERAQDVPRVADPASLRTTMFGEVMGFADEHGTQAWLGIPFAAPPVEKLRWRAPVPPPSWNSVRQALKYGPPCVQYASALAG